MRYFVETWNFHPTCELVEDEEGCLWRNEGEKELVCFHCHVAGFPKYQRAWDGDWRCEDCLVPK